MKWKTTLKWNKMFKRQAKPPPPQKIRQFNFPTEKKKSASSIFQPPKTKSASFNFPTWSSKSPDCSSRPPPEAVESSKSPQKKKREFFNFFTDKKWFFAFFHTHTHTHTPTHTPTHPSTHWPMENLLVETQTSVFFRTFLRGRQKKWYFLHKYFVKKYKDFFILFVLRSKRNRHRKKTYIMK